MSMWKLAIRNFQKSLKNYISLIISLAFTVLIFFNFQNVIASGTLDILGSENRENAEFVIQAATIVLICFMLFFIWYATNIFLTQRKKEIGIYTFMGLTNEKIGKLYMMETIVTGMTALLLGIVFGIVTAGLFQMIMMKFLDTAVEVFHAISIKAVLLTAGCYCAVYVIFVLKGYINIVRSSVLEMLSASKRNEYVRQHKAVLILKSVLGVGALCIGYYLALKKAGMEMLSNAVGAVVFVIIGVYLLFGGLIPVITQFLVGRKSFLYQKQRTLWMNQLVFRMKRNYRTYAIVAVLMLCSVTALATGFAMKQRYDGIANFGDVYTYQVLSAHSGQYEQFKESIEKENEVVYGSQVSVLQLDSALVKSRLASSAYAVVPYSQIKQLAKETGLPFDFPNPKDREYAHLDRLIVMTLYTDEKETIQIQGDVYQSIGVSTEPYLGQLQEMTGIYMVNDKEYERLKPLGQEMYVYSYRIQNADNFEASVSDLQQSGDYMGMIKTDPNDHEAEWLQVVYSVCIFMFMVFVLASGSIIFMKVYHDALEEQERYVILRKIGISRKALKKSVSNELRFAYLTPFLVMLISSYFSIRALGNVMRENLIRINVISVVVIGIFFCVCYYVSRLVYLKKYSIA